MHNLFYSQDLDPIIKIERLMTDVTLAQTGFKQRTLGARVHGNDSDKFGERILLGLLLVWIVHVIKIGDGYEQREDHNEKV
ncbi:hypothetical protein [Laspinema palackyanum]|uniref:hypothetical protein n=1 Tax=Laspinema palackyanum TaxID=3231601 RepID=UPI00345DE87D